MIGLKSSLTTTIAVVLLVAGAEVYFLAPSSAGPFEETCKDINDDLVQVANATDQINEVLSGERDGTILDRVFDHMSVNLNEAQKFRVEPGFKRYVLTGCMITRETLTLSDDTAIQALAEKQRAVSVDDAIAGILTDAGLNTNERGWGMPDIAEVDFSTLKCGDIREEAIALHQRLQDAKEKDPDAEQYPLRYRSGVPHNNAIDVALRKYVRD